MSGVIRARGPELRALPRGCRRSTRPLHPSLRAAQGEEAARRGPVHARPEQRSEVAAPPRRPLAIAFQTLPCD